MKFKNTILFPLMLSAGSLTANELVFHENFEIGNQSSIFLEKNGKYRTPGYAKDTGKGLIATENPATGKQCLEFRNFTKRGTAYGSNPFYLTPGRLYRLSVQRRRSSPDCGFWINMGYSVRNGDRTLKESVAFLFRKTDEPADQWLELTEKNGCNTFYVPGQDPQKRAYITGKGGIFTFPEKTFGKEKIKCDFLIFTSGIGVVGLDDLKIEDITPAKKKMDGLAEADAAEAERLMASGKKQSGRWTEEHWKHQDYNWHLKPFVPIPRPNVKASPAPYKLEVKNGNYYKNGKPAYLMMSDDRYVSGYLAKLLGNDVENGNPQLDFRAERKGKDVYVSLSDFTGSGFQRTYWNERIEEGLYLWYQIGDTYIMWQPKVLREDFREIFTSVEGFFGFRPEHPVGHALRLYRWKHLIELAQGYPVVGCEVWNELNYMDYSKNNVDQFRSRMERKYKTIAAANKAWGTNFASFKEVIPPPASVSLDDIGKQYSLQLRNDWFEAIEVIFGKTMKEYTSWLKKEWRGMPMSIQSYCGLPYDYQNNHVNPVLKTQAEDIYGSEHGTTFYPQWKGGENEAEIIYSMLSFPILRYLDMIAPDKPIFDAESPVGSGRKTIGPESTIVNLNTKWKFKAALSDPKEKISQDNQRVYQFPENDPGVQGKWFGENYDDSNWAEISVPSQWSAQGFPGCYLGWYRKTFTVPEGDSHVYLVGGELADSGVIYLNGKEIYRNKEFSNSFALDLKDKIRRGKKNTLAIKIFNSYGRNGYYWGGIRAPISITSITPEKIPLKPEQMAANIWLRALYGHSGMAICYPYMSEVQKGGLLFPPSTEPEAIAELPYIKKRIDSLGGTLLDRPRLKGNVAVSYSLDSFRAHIPSGKTALPRERITDYTRNYAGILFANLEPAPLNDEAFQTITVAQYPALALILKERVEKDTLKNQERYVRDGGIILLDGVSLTVNQFDGSPLDSSALTGVKERKALENSKEARFTSPVRMNLQTVQSLDKGVGAYELKPTADAEILAKDESGHVVAVRKRIGKGTVYTVGSCLTADSGRKLAAALLPASSVPRALELRPDESERPVYAEVHEIDRGARRIWFCMNWGAKHTGGLVPAKKFAKGTYLVREAAFDKAVPSPSGKERWNAEELNSNFKVSLENQRPYVYLIESEKVTPITIEKVPEAQKRALEKYYLSLFREKASPNGRILWYGGSNYSMSRLPTAVNVIREMGFAVDGSIRYEPLKETVNVLRGKVVVPEKLSSYKMILIPANGNINKAESELLRKYVENGGNLLLMSGHFYHMHSSSSNHNLQGVTPKYFGVEYPWANSLEDAENCRRGEPRYLVTRNIKAHAVTENVKVFCSGGTAGMKVRPDGKAISLIEPEKTAKGKEFNRILAVSEYGKGKIVLMGDTEWLQIRTLALGDNARLFSNIIGWLTGVRPLESNVLKATVKPEEF